MAAIYRYLITVRRDGPSASVSNLNIQSDIVDALEAALPGLKFTITNEMLDGPFIAPGADIRVLGNADTHPGPAPTQQPDRTIVRGADFTSSQASEHFSKTEWEGLEVKHLVIPPEQPEPRRFIVDRVQADPDLRLLLDIATNSTPGRTPDIQHLARVLLDHITKQGRRA